MQISGKFDLGSRLKDKVTGFSGIALCVSFYMTGCVQYGLQPSRLKEDGGVPDWEWFDEDRLIQESESLFMPAKDPANARPGGPQPTAPAEN